MADYVLPFTSQEIENRLTKVGTLGLVSTEDIVPIEKGGTGAITSEQALLNLGGISKTLLWENANIEDGFVAQAIPLDLSEYDQVKVTFIVANSLISQFNESLPINTSVNAGLACAVRGTTSGIYGAYRGFQTNKTQVYFTDAWLATGTGEEINNIFCIPLRIYGIKGIK